MLATSSAVPLHPHAQVMRHRSGAANFVEAGLTKRHTAQRKASSAAMAKQHISYAYPALAPSRAVVTQGTPRGAVRALARGQYASLARPSLATHAVRCLRVDVHHHASVGSLHETAKETEPAARGRCGARSSRQGLKGSVCYVKLWSGDGGQHTLPST